jgi:hypothetical protein
VEKLKAKTTKEAKAAPVAESSIDEDDSMPNSSSEDLQN